MPVGVKVAKAMAGRAERWAPTGKWRELTQRPSRSALAALIGSKTSFRGEGI
jgi:hypothetical protein